MGTEYAVNILIRAIDAATAPVRQVQACIADAIKPLGRLQARFKQLGQETGITRLAGRIKGLHAPLKKSWEEVGKLVAKLGLLGGGMLGGAVAGFKMLFLSVVTGNETLARSMANVTGNADGAKAALAGIRQSLRGWDTSDAANAFMRLKAEGLGTQEADLKKLADVAGHTGKSLTEVAEVLANLKNGQTGGLAEILGGNVKQVGNYIVAEFADATGKVRRMAVKQGVNMAQNAKAMQNLFNKTTELKGVKGGAERFGNSWQGMMQRAQVAWQRFSSLVMDSGPFALLKEKFQGILSSLDELEASGGLQALAEEWAARFCEAIENLWESGKALVAWFKADFMPAFTNVKDFLGGWGGVFKTVAAIMAGPFIVSLLGTVKALVAFGAALAGPLMAGLTIASKGVFLLGKALLATPVGWVITGIAAVAGAAYLIYKHWGKISAFVKSIWDGVTSYFSGVVKNILAAFDQGFLQGMFAIFSAFHPLALISDAMNALSKYLFDFDLKAAGASIVTSFGDGLKSKWQDVVLWLREAWEKLTGWLPDSVLARMGIQIDTLKPQDSETGQRGQGNEWPGRKTTQPERDDKFSQRQETGQRGQGNEWPGRKTIQLEWDDKFSQRRATGAAAIMASGAAAPGRLPEQKVRTEVVITGENLPPGISISTPKSQADKTRLDCGYMMAGVF